MHINIIEWDFLFPNIKIIIIIIKQSIDFFISNWTWIGSRWWTLADLISQVDSNIVISFWMKYWVWVLTCTTRLSIICSSGIIYDFEIKIFKSREMDDHSMYMINYLLSSLNIISIHFFPSLNSIFCIIEFYKCFISFSSFKDQNFLNVSIFIKFLE